MKVLFLHGWHSVPGGVKPTFLKEHGFEVINPVLDDDDFSQAVLTAQTAFDLHRPDVVVGSSRGGAVALNISSGSTPLILLCPAWKKWGTADRLKAGSVILHSRADDVVPFESSEQLVAQSGLPPETLIEVGADHRLADEQPLAVLLWACRLLGAGGLLPWMEGTWPQSDNAAIESSDTIQKEGRYICDSCGEQIVVPLDLTEGQSQTYVEDCPICCHASVIHVHRDEDGVIQVHAEPEQDRS